VVTSASLTLIYGRCSFRSETDQAYIFERRNPALTSKRRKTRSSKLRSLTGD